MKTGFVILSCLLVFSASSYAQDEQRRTGGDQAPATSTATTTTATTSQGAKVATGTPPGDVPVIMSLTNVEIELTLTDQIGSQPPEKKVVSMIVSSGNWGRIRSAGNFRPIGEGPFMVDLNVDARPTVSKDGPIQLQLTLVYAPPAGGGDPREGPKPRPSNINQSLTVVLQSGKPLIVSKAADPVSDRKVVVEVKATILK